MRSCSASKAEPRRAAARCARAALLALAAVVLAAPARALDLDELLQRMSETRGVHARFREVKEIALLEAPLESEGEIFFVPPRRFARLTTRPAATRFVIDGDALSFQDESGGQDFDLSESAMARTAVEGFLVLWNGDADGLRKRYATEFSADGQRWHLALTPRSSTMAAVLGRLTLEGDGSNLLEMILVESNGDRTVTRFQEVRSDAPLTPDEIARAFGKVDAP